MEGEGEEAAQELSLLILHPDGSTSEQTATPPAEAAAALPEPLRPVAGWVRVGVDGRRTWQADEGALSQLRAGAAAAAAAAGAAAAAAAAAASAAAAVAEAEPTGGKKAAKEKKGAALTKSASKSVAASGAGAALGAAGAGAAATEEAPAPSAADAAAAASQEVEAAAAGLRARNGALEGAAGLVVALPALRSARATDHDTGAVTWTREDRIMAINYPDGSWLVQVGVLH